LEKSKANKSTYDQQRLDNFYNKDFNINKAGLCKLQCSCVTPSRLKVPGFKPCAYTSTVGEKLVSQILAFTKCNLYRYAEIVGKELLPEPCDPRWGAVHVECS
jgi:hypothetical protein